MFTQNHYGGVRKSELGTRRSELGISGERRFVKGKVKRKYYRCRELDIVSRCVP